MKLRMFARRARLKASANLGLKRVTKDEKLKVVAEVKNKNTESHLLKITQKTELVDDASIIVPKTSLASNSERLEDSMEVANYPDEDVFKSPRSINQKSYEPYVPDKSKEKYDDMRFRDTQSPLSPQKIRQRIRPTPYLALRRNSTQGYGSDAEEEFRKNRSSTISSQNTNPAIQRRPPPLSRVRTESSCSNISDRDQSLKASRKIIAADEHLRISTAKKEFQVRFNGKVPEKSLLKMFDLIYYNPVTNPMTYMVTDKTNCSDKSIIKERTPENSANTGLDVKDSNLLDTVMPVPQLKLGPNGEMILDEQSLVIETTAEKEARETLANSNIIYMDEFSGSSGFYRREKRTKDWASEETIKFYRCLHTVGTDFSLMLTLFPNRSRRDLKLKFKKEEKQNLNLINKALLHPKTFNIEELKLELEKEEMEYSLKEKNWQEIKRKSAFNSTKKAKKTSYKSKSATSLKDGELAYANEHSVRCSKPYVKKNKLNYHKNSCETELAVNVTFQINEKKICEDLLSASSYVPIKVNLENSSSRRGSQVDVLDNLDMLVTEERDLRCEKLIQLVTSGKISPSTVVDAFNNEQIMPETGKNGIIYNKKAENDFPHSNGNAAENNTFNSNIGKLDICNILTELMNGSLVIVASEDEKDETKVINEIYVMCKETGMLSEKPLDLSEDIIMCILNELNVN